MTRKSALLGAVASLSLALGACAGGGGGGGGGGGTSSTPPPSPPPPPPPTTESVSIFPNPTPQTFASVGTSAMGSNFINLDQPLGAISKADDQQLRIRYTADGDYEVEFPGNPYHGFVWHELSLYGQGTGPTVLTDSGRDLTLSLSGSKAMGYQYSELGSWQWSSDMGLDMIGAVAFGMPTPAGAVPTSGSATYSGIVQGSTDVIASDPFDGPNRASVTGSVTLNFNFASGSLSGAMDLGLNDAAGGPLSIGTFAFKDTVFSVGGTSYSGKFDTAASGDNWFFGQFTGPNAQETIGAWALPFILDVGSNTITADHQAHQAFGAWIAK